MPDRPDAWSPQPADAGTIRVAVRRCSQSPTVNGSLRITETFPLEHICVQFDDLAAARCSLRLAGEWRTPRCTCAVEIQLPAAATDGGWRAGRLLRPLLEDDQWVTVVFDDAHASGDLMRIADNHPVEP